MCAGSHRYHSCRSLHRGRRQVSLLVSHTAGLQGGNTTPFPHCGPPESSSLLPALWLLRPHSLLSPTPLPSRVSHLQSRWFLVSSKPGRHSQAMPPLGVSRQMWAQPWFLFMQFIPSKKGGGGEADAPLRLHWQPQWGGTSCGYGDIKDQLSLLLGGSRDRGGTQKTKTGSLPPESFH